MVKQAVEDNTTKIYLGVCKSITPTTCTLTINGKDNTVKYYGDAPTVGNVYQVFVPFGNMSMAFVIVSSKTPEEIPYRSGVVYKTSELCLSKPIYRQVIQIDSLTVGADNTIQTGMDNTSTLVEAQVFVKKADGTQTCIPQIEVGESGAVNMACYWITGEGVLTVHTFDSATEGSTVIAKIGFIKSTD